jgi:hypothetical protein
MSRLYTFGNRRQALYLIQMTAQAIISHLLETNDIYTTIQEMKPTRKQIARRDFVTAEIGSGPPMRKEKIEFLRKPHVNMGEYAAPPEELVKHFMRYSGDRVTAKIQAQDWLAHVRRGFKRGKYHPPYDMYAVAHENGEITIVPVSSLRPGQHVEAGPMPHAEAKKAAEQAMIRKELGLPSEAKPWQGTNEDKKTDAMRVIRQDYGNHPCEQRFCRSCNWPMLPPAYQTDFWDCTNPDCGKTYPSSKSDIKKMGSPPPKAAHGMPPPPPKGGWSPRESNLPKPGYGLSF